MPSYRTFLVCILSYAMVFRPFSLGFISTHFSTRPMLHAFSISSSSSFTHTRSTMTCSYNHLRLNIDTPETMEDVGSVISSITQPGDVIFLDGDLGAGKTCFARGFIRSRSGISDLRVTSPTYLLCNTYPSYDHVLIHHMDLYRLSTEKEDFSPLNLDHVFQHCISLIEWPSRLSPSLIPETRLNINFRINMEDNTHPSSTLDGDDCKNRFLVVQPHGDSWIDRLKTLQQEGYLDDLLILTKDDP